MKIKDIGVGMEVAVKQGFAVRRAYVVGKGWQDVGSRWHPNYSPHGSGIAVAVEQFYGSTGEPSWQPAVLPSNMVLKPWVQHLHDEKAADESRKEAHAEHNKRVAAAKVRVNAIQERVGALLGVPFKGGTHAEADWQHGIARNITLNFDNIEALLSMAEAGKAKKVGA